MPDTVDVYQLGMNAKVYIGSSSSTGNPAKELGNVKDVTLDLSAGEADITTRDNGGFRATAPALKECTAEFNMQHRPSDEGYQMIRKAWMEGKTVRLAVLTDSYMNKGDGPLGHFSITGFKRNEQMEEAITYDVTAKLAKFEKWLPEETPPP